MPWGEFDGDERFRVIRRLGAGGMGVVYEAHDKTRDLRVALKTMQVVHPGALFRFKKEFRALADLAHPNLAQLHELHVEGEVPFFTMELVEGVDLLDWVRRHGVRRVDPLAPTIVAPSEDVVDGGVDPSIVDFDRLRAALLQLALGVHALHEAGKLHRDLKPSNVMVTREGRVVVLDFGLVADLDPTGEHATERDAVSGTVEYMSPEQAAASPLTEASDWYSFGVIIYEALTGQMPYTGARVRIMMDKQALDPPRPSSLRDDVPKDLEQLCLDLMKRDPKERPRSGEIFTRLGLARPEPAPISRSSAPTHALPFVGREAEIAQLIGAYENMLSGRPSTVHVRGVSGMGKTLLVRRTLDHVVHESSEDVVVLSGRCYEQESVPYKAIDSVIDSLSRHLRGLPKDRAAAVLPMHVHALARLFPVLRRVEAIATAPRRGPESPDPHELRRRAFGALREMLGRIAAEHPLVVWIDDLQWGDVDSGLLLGELLRPPDPPPVLLIASYRTRSGEPRDTETSETACVTALRRAEQSRDTADVREIEVGPLETRDAERLVRLLAFEGDAAPIASESAGNPFLLAELVRFAQSGTGLRRTSSGRIRLEDVLDQRLISFEPQVQNLFQIVAVAGRPIAEDVAIAAAELPAKEARTAIAQLRVAQLLRTVRLREREGLDTYHDRIRETAMHLIPPKRLAHHHHRLAAAIEASPSPDPDSLATHAIAAGNYDHAAELAERAGDQAAAALAFDRAAEWFRQSLLIEQKQAVEYKLAESLSNAGRGKEAAEAFLTLAKETSGYDELELLRRAGQAYLHAGWMDEGVATMRQTARRIGAYYPASQRQAILLMLVMIAWLWVRRKFIRLRDARAITEAEKLRVDTFWSLASGLIVADNATAQYFQLRHVLGAYISGDPFRVSRALASEALRAGAIGTVNEARINAASDAAKAIANQLAEPYLDAWIPLTRGWALYFLGHFSEAVDTITIGAHTFRDRVPGATWEKDNAAVWTAPMLWFLGRFKELNEAVAEAREDARRRGDRYLGTLLNLGYANAGWLVTDEPERAIREAEDAFAAWPAVANDVQRWYTMTACAQAHLYLGNGKAALERIEREWEPLRRAYLFRIKVIAALARHLKARALLAVGAREQAVKVARTLEGWPYAPADAMAASIRAMALVQEGKKDEAIKALDAVARAFDRHAMRGYAEASRARAAELRGDAAALKAAHDALAAESVRNPARMVDLFMPVLCVSSRSRP